MDEIELKLDEKDSLLSGSNKGSKNFFVQIKILDLM